MKRAIVILLLALPLAAFAQLNHAPSREQCNADQRLWLSLVDQAQGGMRDVSATELTNRTQEMLNCVNTYPEPAEQNHLYYLTTLELSLVNGVRMGNFLTRHNLMSKFLQEDAQGKR